MAAVPYKLQRIILAGPLNYMPLADAWRTELEALGYDVISDWDKDHIANEPADERMQKATTWMFRSDALVYFTGVGGLYGDDPADMTYADILFGMAVQQNLNLIVVADDDVHWNPFGRATLTRVQRFESMDEALNKYFRRIRNLYDTERREKRIHTLPKR